MASFELNLTFTTLKNPFLLRYGVVLRCFSVDHGLTDFRTCSTHGPIYR